MIPSIPMVPRLLSEQQFNELSPSQKATYLADMQQEMKRARIPWAEFVAQWERFQLQPRGV